MSNGLKLVAASLLLLGLVVVLIGDPPKQSTSDPSLSFDEYDEVVSAPVPMISAVELAEYLMQQEHHYNLVDLRKTDVNYRIPTSEPHSLSSFLERKIPVNETIFLYSETDAAAVQLYLLLNIRGYFKVKVLAGGAGAWADQVLRPNPAEIEEPQLERRRKVTEFFGGTFDQSSSQPALRNVTLVKQHKKHKGC